MAISQSILETIMPHLRRLLMLTPALFFTACTNPGEALERASFTEAVRVKHTNHLKYSDYDPVKIQGRQPKDFDVHGIDLSRHNLGISWKTVKRAGIDFAFVKATEGKDDQDRRFKEFWAATEKAGIPRSAYHFYYFCATPEAQARNYIRTVPKRDRALPPVLDVEWNPKSPTCRKRPKPAETVKLLKRWLDVIERHYGQKPIIYTTVDFHADNLSDGSLPGYQYWLRSVKAEPKFVYGNRPWKFWQYTGTGKVPGIEGKVDINAFYGNRRQWNTWMARNTR
ncbi:MAG: GH25 family lysozyme [Pseudomonadota bacterium]